MRLLGDLAANPRRRLCLVLVAALGLMFVGLVAARPMRAARSTLAMPRSLEFAGAAEAESFGGGMPMFDGGSVGGVSAASAPMAPASSMQRSEMRQKMAESATTTLAADAFTLSEADREEATAVPGGSMIVRTASLALEVEDVAAAVDGLAKRATADGGFSQSSNVYQDQSRSSPAYGSRPEADLGEAERAKLAAERARPSRAYLTLRVPTGKLDSFLGFCRSLGTRVLRETIAGEDVSCVPGTRVLGSSLQACAGSRDSFSSALLGPVPVSPRSFTRVSLALAPLSRLPSLFPLSAYRFVRVARDACGKSGRSTWM